MKIYYLRNNISERLKEKGVLLVVSNYISRNQLLGEWYWLQLKYVSINGNDKNSPSP